MVYTVREPARTISDIIISVMLLLICNKQYIQVVLGCIYPFDNIIIICILMHSRVAACQAHCFAYTEHMCNNYYLEKKKMDNKQSQTRIHERMKRAKSIAHKEKPAYNIIFGQKHANIKLKRVLQGLVSVS